MKKLLRRILAFPFIVIKKFGKLFHKKPLILIYSHNHTMDEHVMLYYNICKNENYKFKFVFWKDKKTIDKERYKNHNINKNLVIKNKLSYFFSNPDLFVVADLHIKRPTIFVAKSLYLNHGASTICWNNNQNTCYSYSDGHAIYDVYFETSKYAFEKFKNLKNYENHIVFAGNKYSDDFEQLIKNKDTYRKQFNITPEQKVIFLVGSWRQESLFHQLGKEVFDELKDLAKNKKYKFMVSIHPNEYRNYSKVTEPFGKYVDELADFDIIVRKPGTDMMPYLIASDLIVSDFTAMTDNAIMAEKDIVYSDFDDSNMFAYSSAYRLKKILPVISKASELKDIIKKAYPKELRNEILKIKAEMKTPTGFYSELCKNTTKQLLNKK